jgi:hypothetical protein
MVLKIKKKEVYVIIVGFAFLLFGLAAILDNVLRGDAHQVFWYSYFALMIMGIGMITRNSSLIASQISIIAIPYILWNMDFFYRLIIGFPLFGITDYYFIPGPIFGKIISIQHVFNLPLAISTLYILKLSKKDAWKLSFIIISAIFLLTRFLTPAIENINCVFSSCISFMPTNSWYIILLFASFFASIFLTNYLLVKLFYKEK